MAFRQQFLAPAFLPRGHTLVSCAAIASANSRREAAASKKNSPRNFSVAALPSRTSHRSLAHCEEQHKSDARQVSSNFRRFFATKQEPTEFPEMEKIKKSDGEWKAILNAKEYEILRQKGTERPGTGEYDKHYPKTGYYACKGCGFPLYSYAAKFNSGCGWPAYNNCYHSKTANGCHVAFVEDKSHGMVRTEILCKRCDGHLGHVFYGEMGPDTERHCVNSVSVKYVDAPEPGDVMSGPLKASM